MKIDKIVFMGTPAFAVPTLNAVLEAYPGQVSGIFTRPDTIKGRGQKVGISEVKAVAITHNIPTFQPTTPMQLAEELDKLSPDIVVVVAYGMILPSTVTDRYFCLNVHPSSLPAYRGASPIQSSLLAGESSTSISLIRMNEKMDAGPILVSQDESILESDTAGSLLERLGERSAQLCVSYLRMLATDTAPKPLEQDHDAATYCKKITKEDQILSANMSPDDMLRRIKALSPKPGAYLTQDGKRFKLLDATLREGELVILTIQPEGKAPMSYQDFLLGHPKGVG